MPDSQTLEAFCRRLVRDKILPVLQDNYRTLQNNAAKDGPAFFENPQSAASFKTDGQGLVSKGEIEAERLIREAFAKNFPNFAVYGEELGDDADTKTQALVIDPVDGTAAMIRSVIAPDEPLGFGLTLGFLEDNHFTDGLIFELRPDANTGLTLGGIYSGWSNAPAQTPAQNAPFETLICTAPEVMFTAPQERSAFHALEQTAHKTVTSRNCMGFIDTIHTPGAAAIEQDLSLHDVAALIPVLQNAGLNVTDLQGRPVAFKGANAAYGLLAAAPQTHKTALEIYTAALHNPPQAIAETSVLNRANTLNTKKFTKT